MKTKSISVRRRLSRFTAGIAVALALLVGYQSVAQELHFIPQPDGSALGTLEDPNYAICDLLILIAVAAVLMTGVLEFNVYLKHKEESHYLCTCPANLILERKEALTNSTWTYVTNVVVAANCTTNSWLVFGFQWNGGTNGSGESAMFFRVRVEPPPGTNSMMQFPETRFFGGVPLTRMPNSIPTARRSHSSSAQPIPIPEELLDFPDPVIKAR